MLLAGDFYWKQAENMYKKGKTYFRELAKGTQTSPYGLEAEQVISAYSRSTRLKERESEYSKNNLAGPAKRKVVDVDLLRFILWVIAHSQARAIAKDVLNGDESLGLVKEKAPYPEPLSFVAAALVPLAGDDAFFHSFTVQFPLAWHTLCTPDD